MKSKRSGNRRYTVLWPLVFIGPFFICFFLFSLFPMVYSFFISFFNWDIMGTRDFIGLQNYINILTKDTNFIKSLGNTLLIMVMSYPFAIATGLLMAAFLSNLEKGRRFFQTVHFLPYITTPVAIGLLFSFLFDWNTGVINKLLNMLGVENINWLGMGKWAPLVVAFMIIWKTSGYYMALYLAGITSISPDLYEAATVDGANAVTCFFKITLPLLKPVTLFIVLTSIIGGLQLFDEPNILFNAVKGAVGGPDRSCLTIVWNFYDVAFQSSTRLGYGSAIAVTLFLIIVVASYVGSRVMNREEKTSRLAKKG